MIAPRRLARPRSGDHRGVAPARERPGRISRWYAWAVLAVHPFMPLAWIAAVVAATLTLPSLGSAGSAPLEDLVAGGLARARRAGALRRALRRAPRRRHRDRAAQPRGADAGRDGGLRARRRRRRPRPGRRAGLPGIIGAMPGRERLGRAAAVERGAHDRARLRRLRPGAQPREAPRRRASASSSAARARPGRPRGADRRRRPRGSRSTTRSSARCRSSRSARLLIALIVGAHFRSWTAPLVTLAAAAIAYGVRSTSSAGRASRPA